MATQPSTAVRNWFDEPAAGKLIAQIKPSDFRFDVPRNFIRTWGQRAWVPETSFGFELEEALQRARDAFIDAQVGFTIDEHTTGEQMGEWIAAHRLQATIEEVIAAAMERKTFLGWRAA